MVDIYILTGGGEGGGEGEEDCSQMSSGYLTRLEYEYLIRYERNRV